MTITLGDVKFRGRQGNTFPNGTTRLFVPAFRSEEDVARTIVDEPYHVHDIKAGSLAPLSPKAPFCATGACHPSNANPVPPATSNSSPGVS